ncbi:unnamed protein product [Gordionus sp. m RMFG-2023]
MKSSTKIDSVHKVLRSLICALQSVTLRDGMIFKQLSDTLIDAMYLKYEEEVLARDYMILLKLIQILYVFLDDL